MAQLDQRLHQRLDERNQDWMCAQEIIFKYLEGHSQSIGLQEILVTQEGSVRIFRSPWVVELEEAFETKYGQKKGKKIFDRVITQLLINAQTVH
jgi:hypothetical protein